MAKFQFKFESVKKVKKSLEKKAQREVALIDLEIDKCKSQIEEIKLQLSKVSGSFSNRMFASEIQQIIKYENSLENNIKKVENKIEILNNEREKKLNILKERSKESKVFELLEEKYYEDYIISQNREEQITIDEIAIQKFVRTKK